MIPLKVLIPAWTLIGLCAGITLLGRDRAHIAWRHMLALLPGSLVGVAIGLYVFKTLDATQPTAAWQQVILEAVQAWTSQACASA